MSAYRIIRVDGTETEIHERPTIRAIHAAIGCDCCDTVILSKDSWGRAAIVMMVDDTGMIDGRPVNEKATALCLEAFGH